MADFNNRKTFLGGSDAAAILGVSKWSTPLKIYQRKRGEIPPSGDDFKDPKREAMFKRGKRMEPLVVDMLIEDEGIKVTKRSLPEKKNYYIDREYDFIAAEVDFEWEVQQADIDRWGLPQDLLATIQNGEVKTVHPFAAGIFGEENTEEIPVEYAAQGMHGLMVTERKLCMFPVLVGSDNLIIYWVYRDEETIQGMRNKEVAFWNDHVLKGVPPAPLDLLDCYTLFSRFGQTRIEATPEILVAFENFKKAKSTATAMTKAADDFKLEIGKFMVGAEKMESPPDDIGKHVLTLGGKPILTIDLQVQLDLNEKKLMVLYPQVAAACSRIQQFFKFTINKSKKETA